MRKQAGYQVCLVRGVTTPRRPLLSCFPTDRYHTKHLTQPGYFVLKPNPSTLATEHKKANKLFRALLQMFARHLYLKGLQLNFVVSSLGVIKNNGDFDFSQFSSLTQYPPSFRWLETPFCTAHRLFFILCFLTQSHSWVPKKRQRPPPSEASAPCWTSVLSSDPPLKSPLGLREQ